LDNSSKKIENIENAQDWVSQAEAARIRGVSQQGIADLVRRGRLQSIEIGGRKLVRRSEVEAFVPMPIGRPPKKAGHKKAASKKAAPKKEPKRKKPSG
jgi:excisionase family DNA binding protein